MRWTTATFIVMAIGGLGSADLLAHHGGSLYDSSRTVTVRGNITNFHSQICPVNQVTILDY